MGHLLPVFTVLLTPDAIFPSSTLLLLLPFSAALKSSPSTWQNAERSKCLPLSQPVFFPPCWAGACGLRRPKRHEVKTPSPSHFPSPTPALPVSPITSSVRVSSVGSFSSSSPPLRTNMNLSGASPSPASSSDLLGLQESLGRGPACQDLLLVLPCRDSEHVGSKAQQRSAAGRQPRLWGHHLPSLPTPSLP